MPDDSLRRELISGELRVMSPAGNVHGRIAMRLGALISTFVDEKSLGAVYAAETGFIIARDPDTVRAPDVAFVTQQHLEETGSVEGFWPAAPDLAAEVVSPGDSWSEVEAKALCWLNAGTQVVWVLDPEQANVTVYHSRSEISVLSGNETLKSEALLPGWSVPVERLFR